MAGRCVGSKGSENCGRQDRYQHIGSFMRARFPVARRVTIHVSVLRSTLVIGSSLHFSALIFQTQHIYSTYACDWTAGCSTSRGAASCRNRETIRKRSAETPIRSQLKTAVVVFMVSACCMTLTPCVTAVGRQLSSTVVVCTENINESRLYSG